MRTDEAGGRPVGDDRGVRDVRLLTRRHQRTPARVDQAAADGWSYDHRTCPQTPFPGQHVWADERDVLTRERVSMVRTGGSPPQDDGRRVSRRKGSGRRPNGGQGAAVPALGDVPRPGERDGTADTVEHAVQLLSLMARSPDIARRGDRFAYDRPQGAAVQAGGEEAETVGLGHHVQDDLPR